MPKLPYSQPSTPGCCRHQDRHAGSGRSGSGCFPTPWLTSPPLASTQNLRTGIAFKWGEHRLRITDQHPIPSHPHGRAPGVLGGGGGFEGRGGKKVCNAATAAVRRRGRGVVLRAFFSFSYRRHLSGNDKTDQAPWHGSTKHVWGVPSMHGDP